MKITGFVTKFYDNVHPTNVDASNTCAKCGEEFTTDNPCWNSNGCREWGPTTIHVDGECKSCANNVQAKIKLFDQARADLYDAAVTLLNRWQAIEAATEEGWSTDNYPFTESFDEVVYRIGKWSSEDSDENIIDDFADLDDEDEEQEEPKVD